MQRPDMVRLGERLIQARAQRGWNQSECARQAGVHRATLALLEDGKKPHIRSDMLYTLALTLGVSADHLLGLQEDAQPTPSTVRPRENAHATQLTTKRQRPRKAAPCGVGVPNGRRCP
jgi:transcriptional regulator with XRE-family HTH domain